MAKSNAVRSKTVEAGSAITIYRFIVMDASDGQYDHVGTADTVEPDGVSMESVANAGDAVAMALLDGGTVKVEAGAAVVRGAQVASDASGRAITASTDAGDWSLGKALTAAGAAGDIIEVQGQKRLDEVT